MNLKDWETAIATIVDEVRSEPRENGMQKLLLSWRKKLEKEPPALQPFQIDEIISEVRKRLAKVER